MQKSLPNISWALLILLCGYVVAYLALVRVGSGIEVRSAGRFELHPNYHGLPSDLFIPIHELDRSVLRPRMWSFAGTAEDYERCLGFLP
jgi:hypothetical protein